MSATPNAFSFLVKDHKQEELKRIADALERIALILAAFLPEAEEKDGPPEYVQTQDGMMKVR